MCFEKLLRFAVLQAIQTNHFSVPKYRYHPGLPFLDIDISSVLTLNLVTGNPEEIKEKMARLWMNGDFTCHRAEVNTPRGKCKLSPYMANLGSTFNIINQHIEKLFVHYSCNG